MKTEQCQMKMRNMAVTDRRLKCLKNDMKYIFGAKIDGRK